MSTTKPSTTKPSKARKALADVAAKRAALDMSEREHAMKFDAARRRVDELSAQFTEHIEEGAVRSTAPQAMRPSASCTPTWRQRTRRSGRRSGRRRRRGSGVPSASQRRP